MDEAATSSQPCNKGCDSSPVVDGRHALLLSRARSKRLQGAAHRLTAYFVRGSVVASSGALPPEGASSG